MGLSKSLGIKKQDAVLTQATLAGRGYLPVLMVISAFLGGCTSTTQSEWSCPLPDTENCLDVEQADGLALIQLEVRNQKQHNTQAGSAHGTLEASVTAEQESHPVSAEETKQGIPAQSSEESAPPSDLTVENLFGSIIGGVGAGVVHVGSALLNDIGVSSSNEPTDIGIDAVIARENAILDEISRQEGDASRDVDIVPLPSDNAEQSEYAGASSLSAADDRVFNETPISAQSLEHSPSYTANAEQGKK